jgi:anti-anti-sigma regulatory factor
MGHWGKFEYQRVDPEGLPVTIYRLSGGLTGSPECYAFLEEVSERARKGHKLVSFQMEGIEHVTSAGVGILAACHTTLTNAGGRLALAAIPQRAHAILNVLKLLEILGDYGTEEEAIQALLP